MDAFHGTKSDRLYLFSIIGVIVLTIGSVLYLTIQNYFFFVDKSEHAIIDESLHVALLTDNYFEKYRDILSAVSQSACIISMETAPCNRLFERLNSLYPTTENFAATDRNGRFFASGQPYDQDSPPNVRDLPLFKTVKSGAPSFVMNPHIGPISGEQVTGMAIPLVTDTGKFNGVIGASLKLAEIKHLWGEILNQQNFSIFILDRNLELIAASRHADELLSEGKVTKNFLESGLKQSNGEQVAVGANDFKLHTTLSKSSNWKIIALIPVHVPVADYLKNRSYNDIAGALFTLLLGLTVLGFFRETHSRTHLRKAKKELERSRRELKTLTELEQSEQRYHELFQNAPIALWEEDFTEVFSYIKKIKETGVEDLNTYFDSHPDELREAAAKVVILDINKASLQLHQAESKEQLLGGLEKIFNEKSYAIFQQEITALADGHDYMELQGEVQTLSEEKRDIIVRLYRMRNSQTQSRVLIATSDITQQTITEEALRRSQKMEAIGQITGGIAHDFNNILGIIIGNLDLLKLRAGKDENSLKRVNTALEAALRAANLTRQLLGFSRQQTQESEPTDLNIVITEMKSLIRRTVTPAIDVIYRQAENLWPANINPSDLKDAVLNLVLNARYAIPKGGSITIETVNRTLSGRPPDEKTGASSCDYVVLRISDTGCGIPADVIDHIFEPFYTTKPQGKGTGLGLSMVFGFVKRSGGEIRAESRSGEGTTITLLLPRSDTTPKKPEPDDREIDSFPTANETILIVDDEKDLVELAKNYIEGWGYTAITANSGAEALQRLDASPTIDLLFTDVMMPGGTGGYELARAAIRKHPDLKVLFTSGFNKQADQNPSNFPASETLNKPYSPAELSSKLRHLLNC